MGEFAYVTLVTSDSYVRGACALRHSLRKSGTQHAVIALVPPSVLSSGALALLYREFDRIVYAPLWTNRFDASNLLLLGRPELDVTYTKLHVFDPTLFGKFERVCFVDADAFVVPGAAVDRVFSALDFADFAAAPDVGWPDIFNSGVFVCRPRAEAFAALAWRADNGNAETGGSFDGGDQGLLNRFYDSWAGFPNYKLPSPGEPVCPPELKRTARLPFTFNVTPSAVYSYLPAVKEFKSSTSIIHFAGHVKPWDQYRFSDGTVWNRSLSDEIAELHNAWWRIYDDLVKKWRHEDLQQLKASENAKPTHISGNNDRDGGSRDGAQDENSSNLRNTYSPGDDGNRPGPAGGSSNENTSLSKDYYPYYDEKSKANASSSSSPNATNSSSSTDSSEYDSESQTGDSENMVSSPGMEENYFDDDNDDSGIPLEFKTSRYDWNWTESMPPSLSKRSSRSRMNSTVSVPGLATPEDANAFYVVVPKDADVFDEMFGTAVNSRELARVDKNGIPLALKTKLSKLGEIELVAGNVMLTLMNKSTLCNILSVTSFQSGSANSSRASTPVPSGSRRRLSSAVTPRSSMTNLSSLVASATDVVSETAPAKNASATVAEPKIEKKKKRHRKKSSKSSLGKEKEKAMDGKKSSSQIDSNATSIITPSSHEPKPVASTVEPVKDTVVVGDTAVVPSKPEDPISSPVIVGSRNESAPSFDTPTSSPAHEVRNLSSPSTTASKSQFSYASVVSKNKVETTTPPSSPESKKKAATRTGSFVIPTYTIGETGIAALQPQEFPLARYLGGAVVPEIPITTPAATNTGNKATSIKPEHRHAVQLLTSELKSRTKTIQTLEQKVKVLQSEKAKILESKKSSPGVAGGGGINGDMQVVGKKLSYASILSPTHSLEVEGDLSSETSTQVDEVERVSRVSSSATTVVKESEL
ncbi:UNVERIFIED_CONTAM: glycogenin glucosyltransferase [Siphonaria sp. JEL0065]|nr:glycogenin glucosyltransferase [Siphonaria sp. JEL0065]